MKSALAATAALLLAAPAADACDVCLFGPHPTDGSRAHAQDRVDRYNANLVAGHRPLDPFGPAADLAAGGGTERVFLDFSQAVGGVFSAGERQQVADGLADLYRGFDVEFSLTAPAMPFTRVVYDDFDLGGVAVTGIDFRNVQVNDLAFVGTNGLQGRGSTDQVDYAINVGGHEFGHTVGLRHHDSFGPIGTGVPAQLGRGPFLPDYPGPIGANEFVDNTMSTPAFGGSFNRFFDGPTILGERSLVKVQYAAEDDIVFESNAANDSPSTAQPIGLGFLDVLNTLPPGTDAGDSGDPYLPARAGAVRGSLAGGDPLDYFSFDAFAGDFVSVEVMSQVLDQRFTNDFDSTVTVVDAAGNPLSYYGTPAFNDDEIETRDSFIFDLLVPADGTYFVAVDNFNPNDTGGYELFVTSYGTGRIPGDANGDGLVNLADFTILANNFGMDARFSGGDFTGDLMVNLADFTILANNFGGSADDMAIVNAWRATVPEPAAASLALLAGVGLLRRRR